MPDKICMNIFHTTVYEVPIIKIYLTSVKKCRYIKCWLFGYSGYSVKYHIFVYLSVKIFSWEVNKCNSTIRQHGGLYSTICLHGKITSRQLKCFWKGLKRVMTNKSSWRVRKPSAKKAGIDLQNIPEQDKPNSIQTSGGIPSVLAFRRQRQRS